MQPPRDGGIGGRVDLLGPHRAHGPGFLPRPNTVVRRVTGLYVRLAGGRFGGGATVHRVVGAATMYCNKKKIFRKKLHNRRDTL